MNLIGAQPELPHLTPDFRGVVRVLHAWFQTLASYDVQSRAQDPVSVAEMTGAARAARNALVYAEHEWVAQAVVCLYSHLARYEQFREAATLLAFAMPHLVRNDPRVVECVRHAQAACKGLADPETERAAFYLDLVDAQSPDRIMQAATMPRARYWTSVVSILRCTRAIEFGTGNGINVIHAWREAPHVEWVGVDVSARQTAANREQAITLGAPVRYETHPTDVRAECVGLLDCLEHTVYPDAMLDAVESYCEPGGVVVVVMPCGPWSLHAGDGAVNAGAGQHVAVESSRTLLARLERRGRVLDGLRIPGAVPAEGNESIAITYEPAR